MAIYIPLKEALKLCDEAVIKYKECGEDEDMTFFTIYDLGQILSEIANKCGKYFEEDGDVTFAPQIMSESSDPKGSIRYRCYIINEKIPTDSKYRVEFPDAPSTSNSTIFRVLEYSNEFSEKSYVAGNGVVLKESDGSYSWWFDDMNKGEQLC